MSSHRKRSLLDFLPEPVNKNPKSAARKFKQTSTPESIQKEPKTKKQDTSVVAKNDNELYRVENSSLVDKVDSKSAQGTGVFSHDPDEAFLKALERERTHTRDGSALEIKEVKTVA